MYQISYMTKRGGGCLNNVPTNEAAQVEILKLFKRRIEAKVKKDGVIIGEVIRHDLGIFDNPRQRWTWYIDTEA